MQGVILAVLCGLLSLVTDPAEAGARSQAPASAALEATEAASMLTAQHLFYVGRYEEAAALALQIRNAAPEDLSSYELRTSALHFLIKRQIGEANDKQAALKACGVCTGLLADMKTDVTRGQQIARARLKDHPKDTTALFFLGKIDLNHVWLYLGTLGQRTGWGEYWEARHSLDDVLEIDPKHVRARVARAWIDYIVDTRVPRGLKWVLGGGSKKHGLAVAREAANADTDFYSKTEAGFSLWEMLVRDSQDAEALTVAQRLAKDFPENRELVRFLQAHAK
jgi:tetratricopeptide (TPR) repeat protein